MNLFRKLFEQKEGVEEKKISFPADAHWMWEDDYLMFEFLPKENLNFLQKETQRIEKHANENYDGYGFTAMTTVKAADIKTIDKAFDFQSVVQTLSESDLPRLAHFVEQGKTLLSDEAAPVGFGTKRFAIICEEKNGLLQNLWLNGTPNTEEEIKQLASAIFTVGQLYELVLVNWFNATYCDTAEMESILDFFKREK